MKLSSKFPRIQFKRTSKSTSEEVKPPSPVTVYYMVLWPAIVLVAIGLLMTFSATTVSNISAGINPYSAFGRTAFIVLISVVVATVVSCLKPEIINRLSGTFFIICLILQLMVLLFGTAVGGNRNWLTLPLVGQIQPSEFLKLATVLFLARCLSLPQVDVTNWKIVIRWAGIPSLLSVGLVMAGYDMGTALVFVALIVGTLWVAGVPWKWFITIGIVGAVVAAFFVGISPSRIQRVLDIFDFSSEVDLSATTQSDHALWALGSGGLFGLGPGASREKWNYLQEAHTDFIFAIVGEEFGLVGTLILLLTMVVLIWAMLRIASFGSTSFVRIGAAGIASWIGFQAFVNVGTVTGLLPVIGVPFPLVSYGGSSFLSTAMAIGIMLSFVGFEAGIEPMRVLSTHTGGRDPRQMPNRRLARSQLWANLFKRKQKSAGHSTSSRGASQKFPQPNLAQNDSSRHYRKSVRRSFPKIDRHQDQIRRDRSQKANRRDDYRSKR